MSLVEKALQKAQAELARAPKPDVIATVPVAPTLNAGSSAALSPRESPLHHGPFVPTQPLLRIDLDSVRKAGLIAPVIQERVITRQLRIVKQAVLRRMHHGIPTPAVDGEVIIPRTVMLTSALPGDGKTFTSFNFAMSLALEKDYKVILVDADVAKPHISSVLGLAAERGLMEVLADNTLDVGSVVRPTSVKGLYFVPAGQITETATELLSSGRMATILRRLATLEPNLIVVFDSPPVLLTSEAQALASCMSQVLVVVRSNVTPRAAVRQAIDLLDVGPNRAALLLNDTQDAGQADYGYAYGHQKRPAEPPAETKND